ncbi:hypothetical protein CEXT_1951 [Caerostris extrusa]|uniref:Uncharacterized protein n=1 Tax=Caerostris extrusa TaxID=172846 RepID=A0AAV4Q683_CAEEX|nr:hypothetical protein CEXT_1951 [Caerostris extrusa]
MFALCSKLNLTPNEVPATVNDLKDKVQHLIDADQPAAQTPPNVQQPQKEVSPSFSLREKGGGNAKWNLKALRLL